MLRFCGELQLAGADKVAIDAFRFHEAFDEIDAGIEGAIHLARPFHPEARGNARELVAEAVVAVAAIAARGFRGNLARLQKTNGNALLCQRQRRGKSGEAATDDRDIGPPLARKR